MNSRPSSTVVSNRPSFANGFETPRVTEGLAALAYEALLSESMLGQAVADVINKKWVLLEPLLDMLEIGRVGEGERLGLPLPFRLVLDLETPPHA